jgi:CheY-like chemotaxis protein
LRAAARILLDLMMPVMDGWKFLRRRTERSRDIPVVVITAGNPGALPDNMMSRQAPIRRRARRRAPALLVRQGDS